MKTSIQAEQRHTRAPAIARAVFLTGLLLFTVVPLAAQNQTINGTLTVTGTGNTSIAGDLESGLVTNITYSTKDYGKAGGNWQHFALDLGDIGYANTTLFPGLNISVLNANMTLTTTISLFGYSPNTTWVWAQNLYDGGNFTTANSTTQMELTDQGVLSLYSTYYNTGNIIFDPGNQSISFSSGLTIQKTSGDIVFGLGSSGFELGNNVTANGTAAIALGNYAIASGNGAFALGTNITSPAWSEVTVGHFNTALTPNSTSGWAATDPAFVVGIGQNSNTTANGLVVLNNGIVYAGSGNATPDSGSGLPQGVGNRLMWIPQKNSFFAGGPTDWTYGNYVTQWNYGNIGIGDVAMGDNITVTANGSVAMGQYAFVLPLSGVTPTGSVAIGENSAAIGGSGIVAIGQTAQVNLSNSSIYYTLKNGAVAIGNGIEVEGTGAVGEGSGAIAGYDGSIAIGLNVGAGGNPYVYSISNSTGAVVLGDNSTVFGPGAVAIGLNNNNINGTAAIALGSNNSVSGNGSVGIGNNTSATGGDGMIAIGNNSVAVGPGAISIGENSYSNDDAVAIGGYAGGFHATALDGGDAYGGSTAIGYAASGGALFGAYQVYGGTGTVAIGWGAAADGNGATSIGFYNIVQQHGAVGIGYANNPNGLGAIGLGYNSTGTGVAAITLGYYNTVAGSYSIAAGGNNTITGNGSVVLGSHLTTNYSNDLVAGQWNAETANITNTTLQPLFELGNGTSGNTSNAFTVLKNGNTTVNGSLTVNGIITGNIELGGGSVASGSNAIALDGGNASGPNTLAWNGGNASGNNALAFGLSANSSGNGSLAFGTSSVATGVNGIAFDGGNASGNNALAWSGGVAGGSYSLAFGVAANATGNYSFALGNSSVASGANSIALGGGNVGTAGADALAFGSGAYANATEAIALGGGNATGNNSLALGNSSVASQTNAIALGGGAATGNNSLAFGLNSNSTANGSITLGANLSTIAYNSVVVGHYSNNTIVTGNLSGNGPGYALTGNATAWQPTDPVFIVGIGNSSSSADGLVIQNNGNVTIPKRQGDIIMGNFGSGNGD